MPYGIFSIVDALHNTAESMNRIAIFDSLFILDFFDVPIYINCNECIAGLIQ
jgi:hypothetical protein